jgi:hypothetical protein
MSTAGRAMVRRDATTRASKLGTGDLVQVCTYN